MKAAQAPPVGRHTPSQFFEQHAASSAQRFPVVVHVESIAATQTSFTQFPEQQSPLPEHANVFRTHAMAHVPDAGQLPLQQSLGSPHAVPLRPHPVPVVTQVFAPGSHTSAPQHVADAKHGSAFWMQEAAPSGTSTSIAPSSMPASSVASFVAASTPGTSILPSQSQPSAPITSANTAA